MTRLWNFGDEELGLIFRAFVLCALISFFGALSVLGYWWFAPVTPITQFISVVAVDAHGRPKEIFRPGQPLFYTRKGIVLKTVARSLHAHLFNDDTQTVYWRSPPSAGVVPGVGPFTMTYKALVLPDDLPSGNYSYHVYIFYPLNPLRGTVVEEAQPVKFKVAR